MKLISFDVGIKNMAYCIFDVSGCNHEILDWNVLNLMEEEPIKQLCGCLIPGKNKKIAPKPCGKIAKYCKADIAYCDKHAKKSEEWLVPKKEFTQTALKKLKNADLLILCKSYSILTAEEETRLKKAEIHDKMRTFFDKKCFDPISAVKKTSAGEVDLIVIGKNMKKLLNEISNINGITHVIIENQISPIANRMKTIQGMLAQYFIMNNSDTHIEFVSSSNKLKGLVNTLTPVTETVDENNDKKTKYKENKQNGVIYCCQILEQTPQFLTWKHVLETKKKDDLADCFLQGIWYLRRGKK